MRFLTILPLKIGHSSFNEQPRMKVFRCLSNLIIFSTDLLEVVWSSYYVVVLLIVCCCWDLRNRFCAKWNSKDQTGTWPFVGDPLARRRQGRSAPPAKATPSAAAISFSASTGDPLDMRRGLAHAQHRKRQRVYRRPTGRTMMYVVVDRFS